MKKIFLAMLFILPACFLQAQSKQLTIEECYDLARKNYPLIKQHELITKTKDYSVENAAKGYLPQVSFSGQATYQSETFKFPFNIPNVALPQVSKDQYKIQAEVNQTIYDGGAIRNQQNLKRTDETIQQQSLEVSLYAIKERINQLFFGVLLIEEQLKQNDLQKNNIQNGIDKVEASLANGTALRSSLDELKAELIKANQNTTELTTTRTAYLQMLSLFINENLDENTRLVKPQPVVSAPEIKRPELVLYDNQKKTFDIQEKQLRTAYLPKISAFAQGAYGRPTLNIINNNFGFYALGGIKFNWSLSGLYTRRNDKQLLAINRQNLDIQKETFLFNTRISLTQQNAEANKYSRLADDDAKIVVLRESVKNASKAQLANGVITSHDYISQVNAENQARLSLVLHQIQLLQSQYNYKTTSGN